MSRDLISVVIPVYGDKVLVSALYNALILTFDKMDVDFEILMVNDNCPYGSGEEILKLALEDKRLKFIDFSKNYGQHNAIKAGIDHCSGDYLVVMDCDLQDNPEDIIRFYSEAKKGYDIVFGDRAERNDSTVKRFLSKAFNVLTRILMENSTNRSFGNFSIINKKIINELKKIHSAQFEYVSTTFSLGFNTSFIEITKEERQVGKSSYNIIKGIKLALITIGLNSTKPLSFAIACSVIMFLFSFAFLVKLVIAYSAYSEPLLGWTSLMVSIFFIAGFLFAYLAILGLYIAQIVNNVKGRPLYCIKNKVNLD